ncbi:MAG TPA: hypothetical protein VG755_10380 [Nannocystaceae bacterium]|nr:hypothetical protein [Nannocystaceae bacterium]
MKMIEWTMGLGVALALVATLPACEVDEVDDEPSAEALDDEEEEARDLCFYAQSQPPAHDASGTLIGAATQVSNTQYSDGGCDLFVQRVTAGPGDRARTITMSADADLDDEHAFGVWTRPNCPFSGCVWTHHSPSVGLHLLPCEEHGGVIVCPVELRATVTLPPGNDIQEVRAGGRVLEGDLWPVEITTVISQ